MTYLQFLLLFIAPPAGVLLYRQRGRLRAIHPRAGMFIAAIAAIALIYTTPWDNYLVWRGIWGYGDDRVMGTIGYVPIEEYLFFLSQPVVTGLWLYALLPGEVRPVSRLSRWIGTGLYGIVAAIGIYALGRTSGTYLGLILAWAGPVLALQWAYAGRAIWARRRAWALGFAIPTLYLWAADATAIHLGIWEISETYTLGIAAGPLPLEEATFFLVTNLLVVQGLLLFLYPPGSEERPTPEPRTAAVGHSSG